jgi:hypothetical protein
MPNSRGIVEISLREVMIKIGITISINIIFEAFTAVNIFHAGSHCYRYDYVSAKVLTTSNFPKDSDRRNTTYNSASGENGLTVKKW